jgi:hypothetical protein
LLYVGCCPALLSFTELIIQYLYLFALPFCVTYFINSLLQKCKRNIIYTLLSLILLIVLYLLFQYFREKYCLFGYLSNSCMYRGAPPLPPGAVY